MSPSHRRTLSNDSRSDVNGGGRFAQSSSRHVNFSISRVQYLLTTAITVLEGAAVPFCCLEKRNHMGYNRGGI